jgi:hypothetical protein
VNGFTGAVGFLEAAVSGLSRAGLGVCATACKTEEEYGLEVRFRRSEERLVEREAVVKNLEESRRQLLGPSSKVEGSGMSLRWTRSTGP